MKKYILFLLIIAYIGLSATPRFSISTYTTAKMDSLLVKIDSIEANININISGDSGTGSVNLHSQSLKIKGTPNQIETTASNDTVAVSIPDTLSQNYLEVAKRLKFFHGTKWSAFEPSSNYLKFVTSDGDEYYLNGGFSYATSSSYISGIEIYESGGRGVTNMICPNGQVYIGDWWEDNLGSYLLIDVQNQKLYIKKLAITLNDNYISRNGAANEGLSFDTNNNATFSEGLSANPITGKVEADSLYGEKVFRNITTVSDPAYSVISTDHVLHVTYTATGSVIITIPSAQCIDGRELIIKDAGFNAGTYNIQIYTQGFELIDGDTEFNLDIDGQYIRMYCKDDDWFIF